MRDVFFSKNVLLSIQNNLVAIEIVSGNEPCPIY
jgi:hypothetical protein